ncbi:MAG: hypothetical protein ACYCWE_18940 [Eubacteriales bacterium]
MRKALAIILIVISVVFLYSCASDISDEEVRVILTDLVPRSQQLNDIFWGDGIKPEDEDAVPLITVTTAQYYTVAEKSPYKSIRDMKEAAEKVFSRDYLNSVYTVMFEGSSDIQPRFAENDEGLLTIDISYNSYDFKTEIFPETAVVKETGADLIRAEVSCKTNGEPGKMNISLRRQDGVWLIDSPTY